MEGYFDFCLNYKNHELINWVYSKTYKYARISLLDSSLTISAVIFVGENYGTHKPWLSEAKKKKKKKHLSTLKYQADHFRLSKLTQRQHKYIIVYICTHVLKVL